MQRALLLGLLLAACRTSPVSGTVPPVLPPSAPQRAASWTLHGQTFEDPFLWMRHRNPKYMLSWENLNLQNI